MLISFALAVLPPTLPVAGPQTLLFWSERDAWYGYLSELTEAHKMVVQPNTPPDAIQQAAKNIDLAEVVHRITMLRQFGDAPQAKGGSPPARRRLGRPTSQVTSQPHATRQGQLHCPDQVRGSTRVVL